MPGTKRKKHKKALEKAQAVIERKTKVACKEAIERTISENLTGIVCRKIHRMK